MKVAVVSPHLDDAVFSGPLLYLHLPSAWRDELEPESWRDITGHWPTFGVQSHWGYGMEASGVPAVTFTHRRAS